MVYKLLLKLSVAVIAASFASQTVLADTSRDDKRKGFFENLFGAPKKKKTRKSIVPWWKENASTASLYGRDYYGDEDYSDPEPFPARAWEISPMFRLSWLRCPILPFPNCLPRMSGVRPFWPNSQRRSRHPVLPRKCVNPFLTSTAMRGSSLFG